MKKIIFVVILFMLFLTMRNSYMQRDLIGVIYCGIFLLAFCIVSR